LAVAGALGFIGCAIGLAMDPKAMLASYLAAWIAVSAIPIGALGVLLVSYLVRAGWTRDFYAPLSSAALTLPVVSILFVPVLIGLSHTYPWVADTAGLAAFKAAYLTPWFFVLRTIAYLAILSAIAAWATRASGDDAAMTRVASGGLIAWALVVSWAGIDWLESIEPRFHSSIYGLLSVSFDLLAGLAFGLTVMLALDRRRAMATEAYAGVLLATLMLWAYLHAMQYIIIWAGNIPEEVVWYRERLDGGWAIALWAMFIGQFFLPFFALLSSWVRSNRRALLAIASATLLLRGLEAIVLVLPPLDVTGAALILDLPAALLAIGASWLLAWQALGMAWARRLSHRVAPAAG
jgi:hypothetical protein